MKTALLYSGEARTISQTWENHRWYLRDLPNPDIFVSVADDAQADDMLLLKQSFPQAKFVMEKVKQPQIAEPVEKTLFRSGYPRSTSMQGVLRQLWGFNRMWEFFCEHNNPEDYDLFVRVRPDIAFCRCEIPTFRPPFGRIFDHPEDAVMVRDELCLCPWWAAWGGVQDRFAIMGRKAAEAYLTTFQKKDELWEMGCPLHPEQMVAARLKMGGIKPRAVLKAEFITIRLPSPEHPDGGHFPCDPSAIDLVNACWTGKMP